MTPEFEARLQKAIDDGVLPGAVLLARDKSGKINYSSAIGFSSLDPTSPVPMSIDKIFTLASMTKLLTSIAVLQQLEQGRISLQTDISSLLPDLAAQPILKGINPASNKPILQPRKNPILLRHLLSHSSGASYVWADPNLPQYFAAINRPAPIPLTPVGGKTVAERCGYPLSFEPGEGWQYGTGLDWAGLLVEKLSGLSLEDYFTQHILSPLNIPAGEITFFPARFSSTITSPRKAAMTARSATTGKVEHRPFAPPADDISALGGEAAHGSLTAYLKVLYSILVDDGRLLKPETSALLFEGLLEEPEAKKALRKNLETPDWIVGWIPTDTNGEYDWSAGGLVTDGDSHPHRKRGFLQWGGAFNLAWFIDRTSGVCGIFGTQISQPADPLVKPLMKEFEEIIYSKL